VPTPPVAVRQESGITRVLFDTGTLFHLYIGRWTANKKMNESDLLIDEVDKSAFYIGHKKLLPRQAQEQLQFIEGHARRFLDNRSVPFPIGNAKYVSYHALRGVLRRLQEFKAQWDVAVDDLITGYPRFKEEQIEKLSQQARSIADKEANKVAPYAYAAKVKELDGWVKQQEAINRSLYPDVSQLRSRYNFEWRMFKMTPLEGVESMSTLDAETLLAEQTRVRQDLNRWVGEVSVMMHQQLGEAAAQAKRLLETNGKLNPKNLRPLFEAFETFSAVNFSGTSTFEDTIKSIRARFLKQGGNGETDWQLTAEQVNHSQDEVRSLLTAMSELAVDETAKQAGIRSVRAGQFGRVIDIE